MSGVSSIPLRSLTHHWRGNLAVVLAAAVGTAVLCGALFVGDSLRGSLRDRAERQLNGITAAWTGSRLIRTDTVTAAGASPALLLQGSVTVETTDDVLTVPRVVVIGLSPDGFRKFGLPTLEEKSGITAVVSRRLADRVGLTVGGKFRVSVEQFSNVPRSSLLGKRTADATATGFTVNVGSILPEEHPANDFNLLPNPAAVLNVFVPLRPVQEAVLVTADDRRAIRKPEVLNERIDRVNALFSFEASAEKIQQTLAQTLRLTDWGLTLRTKRDDRPGNKVVGHELPYVSVECDRLLLEPFVVDAIEKVAQTRNASHTRTTAYLANDIAWGSKAIPYSIVAAVEAGVPAPLGPFLPPGVNAMSDDEIVLADWKESPIRGAEVSQRITLKFFAPDVETGERSVTAEFKLLGKVPLSGPTADPNLTPPFPGITDRLNIADWKPPFTFDKSRIKTNDENEEFWKNYRTTPKAYITRAAGEKLFSSRFGTVTSIRIAPPTGRTAEDFAAELAPLIAGELKPSAGGIVVEPVRDRLFSASRGGTDFGGLFLGFSLFLIVAALVLVGLMFRLNMDRRATEVGGLLAMGFPPRTVLRVLLVEGGVLVLLGAAVGVVLALAYSRGLVGVLLALWPDPAVRQYFRPHATLLSGVIGVVATVLLTLVSIWFAVRKLVHIPPPALLRGVTSIAADDTTTRPVRRWLPIVVGLVGGLLIVVGTVFPNPDYRAGSFFTGGGLVFLAGLLAIRQRLLRGSTALPTSAGSGALLRLGPRTASRFVGRSLLTVFLLGSATFLLVAVESFRRSPETDFADKTGGSGGYRLIAESDVPLFSPFNEPAGRDDVLVGLDEAYQRLSEKQPTGPSKADRLATATATLGRISDVLPFRVHGGDDASCLNLYQAGRPRAVGVPDRLIDRGGFRFTMTAAETPEEKANPWLLLRKPQPDGAVPVIAEQNTALWMLKTLVGGTLTLPDDNGKPVTCRLVATLQDSVFQSELLMADEPLRKLYPRDEGFQLFLIECDAAEETSVARVLMTGLNHNGLTVGSARERVAGYQAVVSTYLTTFQLLGGLGLLLGILGFAVVLLRGVWERIGELALLRTVGYTAANVRLWILSENLYLLTLGLALGLVAAVLSVVPHVLAGGRLPWQNLLVLVVGVLVVGSVVVWGTVRSAVRIPVLTALRRE
jgi:putative ABC transport system permease protein